MADNKFLCSSRSSGDTVSVETNRILDSCRDRDCYENVRVYLSDYGNELLERTGAVRAKSAKLMWTNIGIDPIQFNRGFYGVTIRFYVKVTFEACISCGRGQELEGIAVLEKKVILYGGECNVNVFRSTGEGNGFCDCPDPCYGTQNTPTAVVEVVEPVLLGSKIVEKLSECNCCCCCCQGDIPERMLTAFDAPPCFEDEGCQRFLTVSLGIFSMVRIVRPAQLLVQATEYAIPEKECVSVEEDDPCHVVRTMPFPGDEFSCSVKHHEHGRGGCGDRTDRTDRPGHCGC